VPKICVIGSNAFSGQDLIDLLLEQTDDEIIGVSRSDESAPFMLRYRERSDLSRFRFHQIDLNKDIDELLALLDREKPSHIINFAAQSEVAPSWEHPDHWFQTNTVALARFVNHMRQQDYLDRYLHISSPEAYGSCQGIVTETTPDNPSTPYAASKSAADMINHVYNEQYGFPVMTVRGTNVYGARQQLFKIIPRTAIYIRLGKKLQLHGGGVAVKSFIHVRDISHGELAILERGKLGERYHLSPPAGVSIRDIVATICAKMDVSFEDSVDIAPERPGQDAAYIISSAKAQETLGWAPKITLEQGIEEVVSWVDQNWDSITKAPIDYIHKP
jgi:dTDP-glucose 4,6-dehydratase